MKKLITLTALGLILPQLAQANSELRSDYLAGDEVQLTPQEQAALVISNRWQRGDLTSQARPASDGAVQFVFGNGQTQIVCSPLHVCDIALEKGEQVNDLNLGDPRFSIEPARTGSGADSQIHLMIKPSFAGISTSMVITTDKRTYHLKLTASPTEYMPYVSFIYPEDAIKKVELIKQQREERLERARVPGTQVRITDLDFNYRIDGRANFKPARVYNDGMQTVIQMPSTISQQEAPVLLVLRVGDSVLGREEQVRVNYRQQGDKYIVDSVFDKAVLIAGVGRAQQKVTIKRGA